MAHASFVGIALAQLGEFVFLLTTILDRQNNESFVFAQKCLIALTVLSLGFSPLWLKLGRRINRLFKRKEKLSPHTMMRYTLGYALLQFKKDLGHLRRQLFPKKVLINGKKLKIKHHPKRLKETKE
jgi:hypothetical protein